MLENSRCAPGKKFEIRCPATSVTVLLAILLTALGCSGRSIDSGAAARTEAANGKGLADEPAVSWIGFGSCLHQDRPQPIFEPILQDSFELFLLLGDNVYGDVSSDALTELIAAYQKQATSTGLSRLRESTEVLAVWDDHDYGLNDAGADFAGREASQKLFQEFWGIEPHANSALTPGVYQSRTYGPPGQRVQILLLDTRYFRSPLRPTDAPGEPGRERYLPDSDGSKTMLGDAQWAWLESQLKEEAELRLIVSSIQVLADGHGWEAWRMLPAQRDKLFAVIRKTEAEGVVILSGDRHRAGIYRNDQALAYPLFEATSSSLNLPIANAQEEAGPYRLGPTYTPVNYGALRIDWTAATATFEIRSDTGQPVLEQSIALNTLRN